MKNLLVTTALLSSIAGGASAQMAFQSGIVDFRYFDLGYSTDLASFDFGARADYDIGQLGLQLDAGASVLTNFTDSIESYSVGTHVYKPLNSGAKIGGYLGYQQFSGAGPTAGIINYGVEGMATFGAIDFEASLGGFSIDTSSEDVWVTTLDAYYQVSSSIELSAGIDHLFSDGFSETLYQLGAAYTLPNMPLSIGATYLSIEGIDSFGITASYAFGPASEERLFQDRAFNIYIGG